MDSPFMLINTFQPCAPNDVNIHCIELESKQNFLGYTRYATFYKKKY